MEARPSRASRRPRSGGARPAKRGWRCRNPVKQEDCDEARGRLQDLRLADSESAATYSRQVHACPQTAFISGSFLIPLSEAFRQDWKDTGHSLGEELGEEKEPRPSRSRVAALTAVKVAGPLAPGKYHDGGGLGHHLRVEPNGARLRVDTIAARRVGTLRRSALVAQGPLIRNGAT